MIYADYFAIRLENGTSRKIANFRFEELLLSAAFSKLMKYVVEDYEVGNKI